MKCSPILSFSLSLNKLTQISKTLPLFICFKILIINNAGSFMKYFECLTYQHVNFIFDCASHLKETICPSMTSSFYKFGLPASGNISYHDHDSDHSDEVNNHELCIDEYRRASASSSSMSNEQTATKNVEWERNVNVSSCENSRDCGL